MARVDLRHEEIWVAESRQAVPGGRTQDRPQPANRRDIFHSAPPRRMWPSTDMHRATSAGSCVQGRRGPRPPAGTARTNTSCDLRSLQVLRHRSDPPGGPAGRRGAGTKAALRVAITRSARPPGGEESRSRSPMRTHRLCEDRKAAADLAPALDRTSAAPLEHRSPDIRHDTGEQVQL